MRSIVRRGVAKVYNALKGVGVFCDFLFGAGPIANGKSVRFAHFTAMI